MKQCSCLDNRLKPAETYTHTHTGNFLKAFFLTLFLIFSFYSVPSFASGIEADSSGAALPADCDSDTLDTTSGTANLRADFDANTIDLRWYNDDTRVNVATASNTCTYDTTISLPTNPTKKGYTFKGWKVIPGTRVEYIESTGTQWIDTGIMVKANTYVDFEYQYTNTQHDPGGYGNIVFGQISGASGKIMGYRARGPWWFSRRDSFSFVDTQKHHVEYKSDGKAYLDGTFIFDRGTFSGSPQSATMLLFAERNDNDVYKGLVKIYNFKIKEGDVLVRDYIPIKDYNSVPCMYDFVSKQCFYNVGTGDFIAGPDL